MQNKLLAFLPEYLSLGLIVYDRDGHLKYANHAALEMFGVTMADIYDVNIFDDPNIGAGDKALLKQGLDVSFETDYDFDRCREQFCHTEIREIRKYFVTKVTIMRDAAGDQLGFLLSCEDVTEKKAQAQEIANSYKRIKSTQREMSLALNAGRLISWNFQVEEGMFYKFNERVDHVEKWSFDFICQTIHPDDRASFLALIDAVTRKHERLNDHIVLRVLDEGGKNYRYYNFVYSARTGEGGHEEVITFIQRDITEDFKYQQDLIQARNKAEEADKLKSTFLATMSHEIRTPLNAIVGFSQLLSEVTDAEEKNEYKQLIETNSDILLKLIGDILDLSKIEAGFIDIKRRPFDLSQVCDELYQSFKQRIKNPEVTLRLVNPYVKCVANIDRQRFVQIFTNFVTNAIKYTPRGEIEMGYACTPGQMRLYVRDTGIGISDEKKNRIFSRFEKLDDFAQGSGLGLSICKAIADATGGEVGFESKANVGSEFWYIGYTDVDFVEKSLVPDTRNESRSVEHERVTPAACIKNLKILVAEDNDSNFLLIRTILKENQLTRATTGVEAVAKVKAQSFDVVLMDMKMPIMNGWEATSRIREFNRTIPVIALTANAFDADREAAMVAGCNYFMTKPINKQELMALLVKFC